MFLSNKITIIFIAITTIMGEIKQSQHRCDMTRCIGKNRIIPHEKEEQKIIIEKFNMKVIAQYQELDFIYTTRRRFTAYCYQGSLLDPNSGCQTKWKHIDITKSQAIAYTMDGICETGWECDMDQCYGSYSDRCLTDAFVNKKGPSSITNTAYNNNYLARHTCTSKWECVATKIKGKIRAEEDSDGTIKWYFMDKDSHKIYLTEEMEKNGHKLPTGAIIYTVDKIPKPQLYFGEGECYTTGIENIYCSAHLYNIDVTIKINPKTMQGIYRSTAIQITSTMKTFKDGKIYTINVAHHEDSNIFSRRKIEMEEELRAASIESIEETVYGLKITQMQAIYNAMANRNKIIDLENILHTLIVHLSKRDSNLLSAVMRGNYKTKWLNDLIFQTCPCTKQVTFPIYTNCFQGFMYYEDNAIQILNGTNCISFNEKEIKNISFSNNTDSLDLEILDFLPPRTASIDDSTWDWLVDKRINEPDVTVGNQVPSQNNIDFLGLLTLFSFKDIMLYFSFCYVIIQIGSKCCIVVRKFN